MLEARCWMLDAGCWMLDAGCWLLEVGCWMLVAGGWRLADGRWELGRRRRKVKFYPEIQANRNYSRQDAKKFDKESRKTGRTKAKVILTSKAQTGATAGGASQAGKILFNHGCTLMNTDKA